MSKVKVKLTVKTKGHERGDVIDVDAETADALVGLNQGRRVAKKAAAKSDEG